MLFPPPSYSDLEESYPVWDDDGNFLDDDKFRQLVGGQVNDPVYRNTCVLRMSRAFNYLDQFGNYKIKSEYGLSTVVGDDGLNYGRGVIQFKNYLNIVIGPPALILTKDDGFASIGKDQLDCKKGIICFEVDMWGQDASGHFTLWNGTDIVLGHHINEKDFYFHAAKKINFWESWVY